MSRTCSITGKGPMSGNKRSHALNATRRKWNVNLQKATIMVNKRKRNNVSFFLLFSFGYLLFLSYNIHIWGDCYG